MADPTFVRTIRATVLTVGPRTADPATQVFALTVSAGVDKGTSAPVVAAALPWKWTMEPEPIHAWATVLGSPDAIPCTVRPVAGAPRPAVAEEPLKQIKHWLETPSDPRIERPDTELIGHERLPATLGEQLAHLATYPGDVGLQLGLVSYFTVAADDGRSLRDATIYAIPTLAGGPAAVTAQPYSWTDANGVLTDVQVQPANLAGATSLGKLGPDLATYWINVAEPESHSWRDDLTIRCRAATDALAAAADFVRSRSDYPIEQRVDIAIRGLVAHAGPDPWRAIVDLAALARIATPTPVPPTTTPDEVVRHRLGLSGKDLLAAVLALPPATPEDILIWCWENWDRSAAVRPVALEPVLRDGQNAVTKTYGAAARHRARATTLAAAIIKVPNVAAARALTQAFLEDALGPAAWPSDDPRRPGWNTWVAAYCTQLWPRLDAPIESPREAKSSGLTMQFDELDGDVVQDRELWKQFAGIGVLIRRKPARNTVWGPWRLLDGARVNLVGGGELFDADPGAPAAAAVIPYRFHSRDGIDHPFVTYEHRSLVTSDAIDAYIGERYAAHREVSDAPVAEARISYARPAARTRDLILPPLVYGDRYQLAAFGIDLAGGMPAEITELDQPFRAKPFAWVDDDGAGTGAFGLGRDTLGDAENRHTGDLTYLRRVPIGALRVRRNDDPAIFPFFKRV